MAFKTEDIYNVYRLHHKADHTMVPQLAGRFAVIDNELWKLEDPFNLLEHIPEGPLTEESLHDIHQLAHHSQYIDVVKQGDVNNGSRPDLLEELKFENGQPAEAPVATRPQPVWEYHRSGMDKPQTLEAVAGKMLMNGQPLSESEIEQIINNCKSGASTLRYKQSQMQKTEAMFEGLYKAEKPRDLYGVMDKLKALQAAGHIGSEDLDTLHKELYEDSLVKDVGNKRAYKDFLSRPHEGAHIALDATHFKRINDTLGHQAGDEAIQHMGHAMRQAMDEAVGRDKGKLFRSGGDEFAAHVPTHEHAALFARALRSKLEAIPPIGGVHKLAVSLGIGHTPENADKASYIAKGVSHASKNPESVHAHSLFPGRVGAIPTGEITKPVIPAAKEKPAPLNLTPPAPVQPVAAAPTKVTPPAPVQPVAAAPTKVR